MRRTEDERSVDRTLRRLVRASGPIRLFTKRVLRTQIVLQTLVTEDAWRAYLDIEDAARARDCAILDVAVRIALARGRASAR
ncbi:MAG: hypothetical protein ACRENE_02745 [Polyangiaceae bacterium]